MDSFLRGVSCKNIPQRPLRVILSPGRAYFFVKKASTVFN